MFKIQTLNKISAVGLDNFPRDSYEVASELGNPDAILVRSADMHEMALSANTKAVARAGAGTNNIPCKELAEKGIELMDAPVSGGEPKAIDGTLSVMVGGKEETFQKYYDLLKTMAASVTYVGPLGSGNVAKLANQVIVAINIAAVSEALTLAVKNGADPEKVYSAIRGGLAGSTVLDAKAPMMMAHNFKPGFRIELHIKDLNNALNAAHATSTALPLTAEVMEMMQALKNDGCAAEDHSALVRYYEKISAVSVEK